MTDIPDDIMEAADRADTECHRNNCQRSDCNGFLCVKALEAIFQAAEKRGEQRERERTVFWHEHCAEALPHDDQYRAWHLGSATAIRNT